MEVFHSLVKAGAALLIALFLMKIVVKWSGQCDYWLHRMDVEHLGMDSDELLYRNVPGLPA